MTKAETLRKLERLTQGYGLYSQENEKDPFILAMFAFVTYGCKVRLLGPDGANPVVAAAFVVDV